MHSEFEAYVSLRGLIDVTAEIKRLGKQLAELIRRLGSAQGKLANDAFVSRASPEVVQQERDRVVDLQRQIAATEENLRDLRTS